MTPRLSRLWWLSGLAGAALTLNGQNLPAPSGTSASAAAQPVDVTQLTVSGNPNERWPGEISMPQMPLSLLIPVVEELTGRVVLRPQGLPNPELSIVFRSPPTRAEFLQAIETVLTLNQIALVPLGSKFVKVVPLGNARIESPPLLEESTLGMPPSGQIAAKLFQLQFLRAGEFVPQISALFPNSAPVIFEKANAVLVTDTITTLQRIETLIERTDRPMPAGTEMKFYTLVNGAKASDIVTKLRTFLQPLQPQIGSSTSYHADDRTNQVILFSDPRQFPLFDELIAKLDVKADPNTRNEVIYLKHAKAPEVSTILTTLITGQTRAAQSTGSTRPINAIRPGNNVAAPEGAPPPPTANAATTLVDVAAPSNEFSSLINIQPDERTNAIIASGTVDDIRLIKELIEKIDISLAQVRIEVVIAEVVLTDEATSGISALGLAVRNGKLVGAVGSGAGTTVGGLPTTLDSTTPTGFATATGKLDLSAVISLTTTPRKNNSSILSVPSITTTHNKEGKIFIGETRPVISGSTSSPTTGSGLATSSSITQQEIGTTVTVTPLIGYDGSVELEITQDISEVAGTVTVDGNSQYIISKRTTESTVSAQTGEIIVLGGLQKRSNLRETNRLGPIPFIGDLLGTRKRREDRTELIFFIRPTVLTGTEADNVQALQQVEQLPNKEAVHSVLQPNGTINVDRNSRGPVINRKK
jgi:Type II secretory pathway, component PulD